jgi:NAD(P)-dependent dehydrogenase (short-subunit alcohol dehydrogenase family)
LFSLQGKTALVTGGTSGIGLMAARGLLEAGASVVVASRKPDACNKAVEELRPFGPCDAIVADVSTEEGCLALAGQLLAHSPMLHILVNNAGTTWGTETIDEFPAQAWDKVLDVNVKSVFYVTRALLPGLRAAVDPKDPARVINIGSASGEPGGMSLIPVRNYSYLASKAAVHHLTRVLAAEFGPAGITVNTLAPGPFPSKMMAIALERWEDEIVERTPLRRLGEPDDIAGAVVYLASRAGAYITGAVLPVDGGISTTA